MVWRPMSKRVRRRYLLGMGFRMIIGAGTGIATGNILPWIILGIGVGGALPLILTRPDGRGD